MMSQGYIDDETYLLALVNRERSERLRGAVAEGIPVSELWANSTGHELAFASEPLLKQAEADLARWAQQEWHFSSWLRDDYPVRLRQSIDGPPFIFYRGDLGLIDRCRTVAIVGSRDADQSALAKAMEASAAIVARNWVVVSGLARGVDAAAHAYLRHTELPAVGVIASPISGPYTPRGNIDLHELVAAQGLLISQFAPHMGTRKHHFLERNVVMSALSSATLVIAASENSGTRHQAFAAVRHGRPLILAESVLSATSWGRQLVDTFPASVSIVHSRKSLESALDRIETLDPAWSLSEAHRLVSS